MADQDRYLCSRQHGRAHRPSLVAAPHVSVGPDRANTSTLINLLDFDGCSQTDQTHLGLCACGHDRAVLAGRGPRLYFLPRLAVLELTSLGWNSLQATLCGPSAMPLYQPFCKLNTSQMPHISLRICRSSLTPVATFEGSAWPSYNAAFCCQAAHLKFLD